MNLSILTPAEWKLVISNEKATVSMKELDHEEYLSASKFTSKAQVSDLIKAYDQKDNMTVFP